MAEPRRHDDTAPPSPETGPPNARDATVARPTALARRRPVGMVLVAALLLFNVIGAAMGLIGTLTGAAPAIGMGGTAAVYFVASAAVLGVILYGFWRFERWGWVGALVVTVVGTLLGLFQLITFLRAGVLIGNLIGVLIGVAVIWYLTRPAVRAMFRRRTP
ncbi:MAG: hypothetical protein WCZ23_17120 [Rhodospirillaceae bacterium]